MIRSPAFGTLSRAGFRMLFRLVDEHGAHGAQENGRLPATFDDFAKAGVKRHDIKRTIAECEALGFIVRTETGRRAYGMIKGRASRYRLTFFATNEDGTTDAPSNEWEQIKSREEAEARVRHAQARLDLKDAAE